MRNIPILAACILGVTTACSQHVTSPLPAGPQGVGVDAESFRSTIVRPDNGFKSLYSFKPVPDAGSPFGTLLFSNGIFYSNALNGGTNGIGAVYKVSAAGKENVLHSFAGAPSDGKYPIAGLAVKSGEFYGTTGYGGKDDLGTVFKVSATGSEHVLYSFTGPPDGQIPQAALVFVNGAFYSTTEYGGASGIGSVFKVTTSGTEQIVYSFNANQTPQDGRYPIGDLILVNGMLYGTTTNGGASNLGTIFKVSPSGTEHVLYSFGNPPDGSTPYAGLVNVNGTFYGTTQYGGAGGSGTVFKVSPAGVEHVIYSFKGSPDGATPYGRLTLLNGTLYGTTYAGGANGSGTIFRISTSGAEQTLYSLTGAPYGGSHPAAGMTLASGALYGSTTGGGKNLTGTIFKYTP